MKKQVKNADLGLISKNFDQKLAFFFGKSKGGGEETLKYSLNSFLYPLTSTHLRTEKACLQGEFQSNIVKLKLTITKNFEQIQRAATILLKRKQNCWYINCIALKVDWKNFRLSN